MLCSHLSCAIVFAWSKDGYFSSFAIQFFRLTMNESRGRTGLFYDNDDVWLSWRVSLPRGNFYDKTLINSLQLSVIHLTPLHLKTTGKKTPTQTRTYTQTTLQNASRSTRNHDRWRQEPGLEQQACRKEDWRESWRDCKLLFSNFNFVSCSWKEMKSK